MGRISGSVYEQVCIVRAKKKTHLTEAPHLSAPHPYAFRVYVRVTGI